MSSQASFVIEINSIPTKPSSSASASALACVQSYDRWPPVGTRYSNTINYRASKVIITSRSTRTVPFGATNKYNRVNRVLEVKRTSMTLVGSNGIRLSIDSRCKFRV